MPRSVARKASKKPTKLSKRRSVPKKRSRKSSKRTTKKQRGRGLLSRFRSSKGKSSKGKSPKRKRSKSSKKSPKKMKGGASLYGFDLNDMIGGLPAVVKSLSCRGQPGSNLNK